MKSVPSIPKPKPVSTHTQSACEPAGSNRPHPVSVKIGNGLIPMQKYNAMKGLK